MTILPFLVSLKQSFLWEICPLSAVVVVVVVVKNFSDVEDFLNDP